MATLQDYFNSIYKSVTKQIVKIEFLRPQDNTVYETVIDDIILSSSSYSAVNSNRTHRTCQITFNNITGKYTPNIDGLIWVNRKFRLYLGIETDSGDYYFPKGVFVIQNPNQQTFTSEETITISGVDKFSLLDGSLNGTLEYTYGIPNGTNIITALISVLTDAGDDADLIYDNDYYSYTLPYDLYIEAGDTYADIIEQIAGYASANYYYNETGNLVFLKDIPDITRTPILSFDDTINESILLENLRVENDFKSVVNSITVLGDNVNGATVRFTYENNDPSSLISIPNIGKKNGELIEDALINTEALAEQRAIYELRRRSKLFVSGSCSIKKIYHLIPDDIIEITGTTIGFNKRKFVVTSIDLSSLDVDGEMSLNFSDALEFI